MALFNWNGRRKAEKAQLEQLNIENLALRAINEYRIHDGQANMMKDDPQSYIEQGYSSNTTVYSIITRIDDMRKQSKLLLKDKDNKTIENHELLRFLNKVNPEQYTDEFITQILTDRLVVGEFFVYKLSPTAGLNKGKTMELYPLPTADVQIIEGDIFKPVRGYKVEGNYNVEMDKEAVFHSKMYNPNAFKERSLHGMSPLKAGARTVSKLNQIEITETKSYENQGPPYILFKDTTDPMQRLTDTQQEDLTAKIKNSTKKQNKGLPFIAKDKIGALKLGNNLSEMNTTESGNAGVIALSGVYHFPAELGGYGQKTYNNMKEARKAAWTDCIIPALKPIELCLNSCLIEGRKEYEGLRFEFDYSEIEELQEGMEVKVTWMKQAGYTYNEIRIATGKTPINNPLMDEPVISMGETFLSDYGEPLDEGEKDFSDYMKGK